MIARNLSRREGPCRKNQPAALLLPAALLAALWLACPAPACAQSKVTIGRIERARLYPSGLLLKAKIDTGARSCSLNAQKLTVFTRDGEAWARFIVTNHHDRTVTLERKIIRTGTIKQKNNHPEKRPVILMGICIGRHYREVEVNLVDRSDFNYPLLIGRAYLQGDFLVDPDHKYTREPRCFGAGNP